MQKWAYKEKNFLNPREQYYAKWFWTWLFISLIFWLFSIVYLSLNFYDIVTGIYIGFALFSFLYSISQLICFIRCH